MKTKRRKIRKDCKCDCGHTKEQHYIGEGQCRYCGCTWFYPCIARVKKNIAKKEAMKRKRKVLNPIKTVGYTKKEVDKFLKEVSSFEKRSRKSKLVVC
jgi:hypothetical protein